MHIKFKVDKSLGKMIERDHVLNTPSRLPFSSPSRSLYSTALFILQPRSRTPLYLSLALFSVRIILILIGHFGQWAGDPC